MTLKPQPAPTAPDENAELSAAVETARTEIQSGVTIPYEKVRAWLLSWGTKEEQAPPECD